MKAVKNDEVIIKEIEPYELTDRKLKNLVNSDNPIGFAYRNGDKVLLQISIPTEDYAAEILLDNTELLDVAISHELWYHGYDVNVIY